MKIRQALKNQKGFTLVELMVVVIIIGILAAIALPNFYKQADKAKVGRAKAELGQMRSILITYKSEKNALPANSGEFSTLLQDNGFNGIPNDPWGNPYQYVTNSTDFAVYSMGADGQIKGKPDDVVANVYGVVDGKVISDDNSALSAK